MPVVDLEDKSTIIRMMSNGDSAGMSSFHNKYFELADEYHVSLERTQQCMKVENLRKVFEVDNRKLVAVNDVNLTMYKDEIFVLLGHNGAGKTTTFSMLSGLIPATSGTCTYLNGKSMYEQMSTSR